MRKARYTEEQIAFALRQAAPQWPSKPAPKEFLLHLPSTWLWLTISGPSLTLTGAGAIILPESSEIHERLRN